MLIMIVDGRTPYDPTQITLDAIIPFRDLSTSDRGAWLSRRGLLRAVVGGAATTDDADDSTCFVRDEKRAIFIQ
ncbi:hypothetical protein EVAR_103964_1 [Eumeta japonica]|uniref:Uncharacterized protein n=1 Tax=Eumeta variegata TaxID=151549 RepID=A0A4C1YFV7_EUMVA|nr:hypothetical protein EVAR_103964_1 [Eumeta japonica]